MAISEKVSVKKSDTENGSPLMDNHENPLSEREMDVARLLATGASNGEIASDLTISPHTVKVHLRNIFEKLEVNSRTEASMMLVQRGWLTVPGVDAPAETLSTDLGEAAVFLPADAASLKPEPLLDQEPIPSLWQRLYLLAGIALTIFSFFTPTLFSNALPAPDLLTDRGSPALGKPPITDTSRWMARTPLFEPRSRMAVAKVGDKVYTIGGEKTGGSSVDTVDMYDLSISEWSESVPLPMPLANAAAAALNGRIYVAGGNFFPNPDAGSKPEVSNVLWRLNTTEDENLPDGTWTEVGTLPEPLTGSVMVATEDALYLIGGWDGESMRNEIWRVVPPQNPNAPFPEWDLVNRMELSRAFFGAVYFDKRIYIVGGHDGQRELARADAFDPVAGTWTPLPPLTTPRGGLTLASDNRSIFAFGGGWNEPVTTHERFDLNTKIWSNFPSPITGEWRHMVAFSHENKLYLIGGWSGDYLDVHLQYENLFQRLLIPLIHTD